MKTILKWASWLLSAVIICFMVLGSLGYLFGNIHILGVKWGNILSFFASYFTPVAILLVLLSMSCFEKRKE